MNSRSFLLVIMIIALVGTLSITHFPVVRAQTADQLKGNLDALSLQIKALDDEIKAYNTKISKTQGEAKTLKSALSTLEARRVGLSKDIAYTKLRINQAEQNISFTQNKIQNTESVLEQTKNALSESLRILQYYDHSLPPFVGALGHGAHLSDALDLTQRGSEVTYAINEKTRALKDAKTTLSVQKASYEERKTVLLTLNNTLAGQKQIVEQTAYNKNSLLSETKNKETAFQALLAERKKKKGQLEAEMLDVEAKLKTVVDVSKIPKFGKGVLRYPVEKVIITQYFGNTPFASQNPQVYNGSGHNGIDFGIRVGTPILSAASGIVLGTGDTDKACNGVSYGRWVLIRHQNGLSSLYAHLSVIQVREGDSVSSQQQIALSGNTGYSTGPHLHFTVYASDAVQITNYVSKVCGTNMRMPIAPRAGYLNPLSYF